MPNLNGEPVRQALRELAQIAPAQLMDLEAFHEAFIGKKPAPTGKRGEELFNLILSGIKEVYEVDAVIAGGAVRDLEVGIETPKDVDVFIPLDWSTFTANSAELGWQVQPYIVGKGPYDKSNCDIPSTARGSSSVQGVAVDLVFVNKPLDPEYVAKFPVHAQRCVYTLEGGKVLSPEARKDIENKAFTIDPTLTNKVKLKNTLDKIHSWQKRPEYKAWKIVEPDIKEWWELKDEQKKTEDSHKEMLNKYIEGRTMIFGDKWWEE